jgi:hypothetical protein
MDRLLFGSNFTNAREEKLKPHYLLETINLPSYNSHNDTARFLDRT